MKSYQLLKDLPGIPKYQVYTRLGNQGNPNHEWYNETTRAYVGNIWLQQILDLCTSDEDYFDWFQEVPSEQR